MKKKSKKSQMKDFQARLEEIIRAGKGKSLESVRTVAAILMIFKFQRPIKEKEIKDFFKRYSPSKAKNKKLIRKVAATIRKIREERLAFERKQKKDVARVLRLIK